MKILIVTYTYPPAKSVNGFRPFYFARALREAGHHVSVMTRHFTGMEVYPSDYHIKNLSPFQYREEEGIIVYRIPHYNPLFWYHSKAVMNTFWWKAIYFIQLLLFGVPTQESYNKYFRKYLALLFKTQKYDIIQVESGPSNLVMAVHQAASKYRMPFIIDYRDPYNHDMYREWRTIPLIKRMLISYEKRIMKKSHDHASGYFSAFTDDLSKTHLPSGKASWILNGYDDSIWKQVEQIYQPKLSRKFTIASIGTLYHKFFLEEMLSVLQLFCINNHSHLCSVKFVAPGSQQVINEIKKYIPDEFLDLKEERMSYKDSLLEILDSDVLIYHGWPGYTNIVPSKIFDYLRSGKQILITPMGNGFVENLIKNEQAGIAADTFEAIQFLQSCFQNKFKDLEGNRIINPQWARNTQCDKYVQLISQFHSSEV